LVKKEHIILGALIAGVGLAYLFRDKIAQYVSQVAPQPISQAVPQLIPQPAPQPPPQPPSAPQPVPIIQPILQPITPIKIWTNKSEYKVGEMVYVYGSATPAEDIDVYVYQGNIVRAKYTIYLKTLNKNYTGFIGSGFCRNCTLILRGVGRESGNVSNTVEIRILG
jgi:hypothetical protein